MNNIQNNFDFSINHSNSGNTTNNITTSYNSNQNSHLITFVNDFFSDKIFKYEDKINFLQLLNITDINISSDENISIFIKSILNLKQLSKSFACSDKNSINKFQLIRTALLTLDCFNRVFCVLNSNEPTIKRLISYLEILKSDAESWLLKEGHLELFFSQTYEHLNVISKGLNQLLENDVKRWTSENIQNIFTNNFLTQTYHEMYNLAILTCNYTVDGFYKNIREINQKSKLLLKKLKLHPYSICAQEAKKMGQSRAFAIAEAIKKVRKGNLCPIRNMSEKQEAVFLNHAVFKQINFSNNKKEKALLNAGCGTHQMNNLVQSYDFKDLDLFRLGIPLDEIVPSHRRYHLDQLSYENQLNFLSHLEQNHSDALFLWEKASLPYYRDENVNFNHKISYEFFNKQLFKIKLGTLTFILTFNELLQYHSQRKIDNYVEIAMENNQGVFTEMDNYFNCFTYSQDQVLYSFSEAVTFYQQIDKYKKSFFAPSINENNEELFKSCESQNWELWDHEGEKWISTSFQKLYQLYVCKEINLESVVKVGDVMFFIADESQIQLMSALSIPTTFIVPELTKYNPYDEQQLVVTPLHHVSGEPSLVSHSIKTMDIISQNNVLFSNIIKKLIHPANLHKAFLSLLHFSELQSSQISVTPILDSNSQRLLQYKYVELDKGMSPSLLSLLELMDLYLQGKINDSTSIIVYDPLTEERSICRLDKNKELYQALNAPWDLQILDNSKSSVEEINMMKYTHGSLDTKERSLFSILPIRNYLLQIRDFKDYLLDEETLMLIVNALEAPIENDGSFNMHYFPWKWLLTKDHEDVKRLILTKISQLEYTLNYYTSERVNINVQILNRKIAEDLSNISNKNEAFWKKLQDYFVKFPKKSEKIKDHIDKLMEKTPQAKRLRRLILKGLLPNLTWLQHTKHRMLKENCLEYLKNWNSIKMYLTQSPYSKTTLKSYILPVMNSHVFPFSKEKHCELMQELKRLINVQKSIKRFRQCVLY